jgi:hypothetical protein
VVGRRQPRQWPVESGLCSARMWRTADEVNVAARTSAMLWIWSLGSRAVGGEPITRAAGCSDPPAVSLAEVLPASSPSLFPATPLLLSPVGAPYSPCRRPPWAVAGPGATSRSARRRLVPPVPMRCAGFRCVSHQTHRAVCRSRAADATSSCTCTDARASYRAPAFGGALSLVRNDLGSSSTITDSDDESRSGPPDRMNSVRICRLHVPAPYARADAGCYRFGHPPLTPGR